MRIVSAAIVPFGGRFVNVLSAGVQKNLTQTAAVGIPSAAVLCYAGQKERRRVSGGDGGTDMNERLDAALEQLPFWPSRSASLRGAARAWRSMTAGRSCTDATGSASA